MARKGCSHKVSAHLSNCYSKQPSIRVRLSPIGSVEGQSEQDAHFSCNSKFQFHISGGKKRKKKILLVTFSCCAERTSDKSNSKRDSGVYKVYAARVFYEKGAEILSNCSEMSVSEHVRSYLYRRVLSEMITLCGAAYDPAGEIK